MYSSIRTRIKLFTKFFLLSIAVTALTFCGKDGTADKKSADEPAEKKEKSVEVAAAGLREVDAQKAGELISRIGKDLLILDVRSEHEYKKGHIPNAELIPLKKLPYQLEDISQYKVKHVLIYGGIGGRGQKGADRHYQRKEASAHNARTIRDRRHGSLKHSGAHNTDHHINNQRI